MHDNFSPLKRLGAKQMRAGKLRLDKGDGDKVSECIKARKPNKQRS